MLDIILEIADDPSIRPLTPRESWQIDKLQASREAIFRVLQEQGPDKKKYRNQPHKYGLTLKKACQLRVERLTVLKQPKTTISKIWLAYNRLIKFNDGKDLLVSSIKPSLVFRHIEDLRLSGFSSVTVSNDLSYLNLTFKYVHMLGYLEADAINPFIGHSFEAFDGPVVRQSFTPSQIELLLREAKDDLDLTQAIYVAYYTGARIDEIFTARIIQRDDHMAFSIKESGGKTASSTRIIPVSTHLSTALTNLGIGLKHNTYLSWKSKTSASLGARFARLKKLVLEREGILGHADKLVFHSFRHGFITDLFQKLYPEIMISELTGHSKSSKAKTESGRVYLGGFTAKQMIEMVEAISPIPSPSMLRHSLRSLQNRH